MRWKMTARGRGRVRGRISTRRGPLALFAVILACLTFLAGGNAQAQTKSLKLYYLHTGEKAEIVFKRNGKFDPAGLKKINWFLRDWRRNEPTKMDPNLFDLIWEVYRKSGSTNYIHVVSGYRAPASNEMLRKRGRGVAKNSQHTHGKAMDFFIPGVKLATLREIGLKLQVGGVGFYPTSGSPFVHMDTGSVRHWPRMSRAELARVFPDGKTMHIPADGKPLAHYEQAVAEYKRRTAKGKLVPQTAPDKNELTFFQRLAKLTKGDEDDDADTGASPAPRAVATKNAAPEPVEAVAVAAAAQEEPQYAELPRRVPVPLVAPRQGTTDAGGSLIAALTETPAQQVEAAAAQIEAVAETAATTAGEGDGALASLAVPIPVGRPEYSSAPAGGKSDAAAAAALAELAAAGPGDEPGRAPADAPAGPDLPRQESSALAMLPPKERPGIRDGVVAALTPEEIEDLRRMVRPKAEVIAGLPGTGEPAAGATPAQTAEANRVAAEARAREQARIEAERKAATELAAKQEAAKKEAAQLAEARAAEEAAAEEARQLAEAEAAKVEAAKVEAARIEAAKAREQRLLASLPIPQPAPRDLAAPAGAGSDQLASLVTSLDGASDAPMAEPDLAALAPRQVSLDQYSAPQGNASTIGKWALAGDTTILALDDVQAPAYGRNVIRQVGGSIVVQNFNLQAFGPGRNGFNGKAVKPLKFARVRGG
ncbi:MAG: DUF882 domain-containing protein [Nitratireductor sp.]|nr:DUF882 domain-containing protein [Nitratireductor sp.]